MKPNNRDRMEYENNSGFLNEMYIPPPSTIRAARLVYWPILPLRCISFSFLMIFILVFQAFFDRRFHCVQYFHVHGVLCHAYGILDRKCIRAAMAYEDESIHTQHGSRSLFAGVKQFFDRAERRLYQ